MDYEQFFFGIGAMVNAIYVNASRGRWANRRPFGRGRGVFRGRGNGWRGGRGFAVRGRGGQERGSQRPDFRRGGGNSSQAPEVVDPKDGNTQVRRRGNAGRVLKTRHERNQERRQHAEAMMTSTGRSESASETDCRKCCKMSTKVLQPNLEVKKNEDHEGNDRLNNEDDDIEKELAAMPLSKHQDHQMDGDTDD